MYDVSVIGAGPVGSYIAYRLARLGYEVVVFEAKEAIGSQVCCTGIISRECYDLFSPTSSVILREARSAKFFAASGRYLRPEKNTVQAYIIDRAAFDVALAKRAQEAGARYFLQSEVTDALLESEGWRVEVSQGGQKQTFNSRAMVIACGFGSSLPQRLGMGRIGEFLVGAQTEVNTGLNEVEVYFDQSLAPGGFAWLVPTTKGKGLAGLLTRNQADSCLKNLLDFLFTQGKIMSNGAQPNYGIIPLKPLSKTCADRVLVVGEAAGQVKPTTGGGVYYGLLCADIAAEVLHQAFLAGNFSTATLSLYQKKWKARLNRELTIGYWARNLLARLSNNQIDYLFHLASKNGGMELITRGNGFSFDWHSQLLLQMASYLIPFLKASEPETARRHCYNEHGIET